jgi:hypothetical protein
LSNPRVFVDTKVLVDHITAKLLAHKKTIISNATTWWIRDLISGDSIAWPQGEYDLAKVAQMPESDFIAPFRANDVFYEFLPWHEDGRALLDEVEFQHDRHEVVLLVRIVGVAATGHLAWIQRELPHYHTAGRVVCVRNACDVDGPEAALITDDWRFAVEGDFGGRVFVVPRYWNDGHAEREEFARKLRGDLKDDEEPAIPDLLANVR